MLLLNTARNCNTVFPRISSNGKQPDARQGTGEQRSHDGKGSTPPSKRNKMLLNKFDPGYLKRRWAAAFTAPFLALLTLREERMKKQEQISPLTSVSNPLLLFIFLCIFLLPSSSHLPAMAPPRVPSLRPAIAEE